VRAADPPHGGASAFFVRIAIDVDDIPDEVRPAVLADERTAGRTMRARGHLERIWRVPGSGSSISVWWADDEIHVHALLDALQIAPWTQFEVTAIEPHPLENEVIDAN
jgi:muconolactone D-isomerase